MNTQQMTLDPAHVARIESAYSAHLRALRAAFGITPIVVNYDHDRDYVDLPSLPRDLQLRAPLEGGLVVEAYEYVPDQTTQENRPWFANTAGLFCPRGDEPGEWWIAVARWEAVDKRAPFEFSSPPRIKVGLSVLSSWTQSTDRSPHSLTQAVGTAIHSAAIGRRWA